MAVNGLPVFMPQVGGHVMQVPADVFHKLSYNDAQQLSGNMMNIPAVGSVFAAALLSMHMRMVQQTASTPSAQAQASEADGPE